MSPSCAPGEDSPAGAVNPSSLGRRTAARSVSLACTSRKAVSACGVLAAPGARVLTRPLIPAGGKPLRIHVHCNERRGAIAGCEGAGREGARWRRHAQPVTAAQRGSFRRPGRSAGANTENSERLRGTIPPSAMAVNESPDCDSRIDSGFVLIVILTGRVIGEDEPAGVTTILPRYVPAGKPAVLAVTASESGVLGVAVPVAGLRMSQLFCLPESSVTAAANASEPPPALRTVTACVRVNEPWGKA